MLTTALDPFIPWLLAAAMLVIMRRLERWLHQHLFKAGWLFTKNFQSTTVIYYLLFLPGVILHEAVTYLIASFLNVRAELVIAWPQAQEVARLRLGFVKLAKVTNPFKNALITLAPLLIGLLTIYTIANGVLRVNLIFGFVQVGQITEFGTALDLLTRAPDFWLWVYLIFTIANTMWPTDFKPIAGSRTLILVVVIVVGVLLAFGFGTALLDAFVSGALLGSINAISGVIGVVLIVDLVVVAALGTFEAIFERITGDSATFQNGKLVAVRRAERLQQQAQQRAKALKLAEKQRTRYQSVYELPLPLPTLTARDESITVRRDERNILAPNTATAPSNAQPALNEGGRAGASLITGTAVVKRESAEPVAEMDED